MKLLRHLHLVVLCLVVPATAFAANLPCNPCVGVQSEDPRTTATAVAAGRQLPPEARLYVGWTALLEPSVDVEVATSVRAAAATPWPVLVFTAPAPIALNAAALQAELATATRLAHDAGPGTHFTVSWRPAAAPSEAEQAREYAFLFKRAAVALTGAVAGAQVFAEPPLRHAALRGFYAEEVAAYVDGIALAPTSSESEAATMAILAELDPGKPVALHGVPYPAEPLEAMALAAAASTRGFSVTLFALSNPAADLSPLEAVASEFSGDLSYDSASSPEGTWAFVRGEDLGLRVVARVPTATTALLFPDPGIKRATRVAIATGAEIALGGTRVGNGVQVIPGKAAVPVALLRLDRETPSEYEAIRDQVTVAGARDMPVEEILRRLQAFEDAQSRALRHYSAVNTTTLAFRVAGSQTVEATFEGDTFVRQGEAPDWAWQRFFLNGVRWRGESLPEIPLVQPEKAAAMPLEVLFTKEYRYSLRGTDTVNERPVWVVDFAPAGPVDGKQLYQGTVWVDRELYARVRTKALQLGLAGDVISNEETLVYTPIRADGTTAPWQPGTFVLPLEVRGQQLLSVLNNATLVEKSTRLSQVKVNDPDFETSRAEVLASNATMVRDTKKGLRYLVKSESGERVVKEGFDADKLFAIAGVFYDDSLDYPLPLVGVNYLSLDLKKTGMQANVFFAGALLTANLADPTFLGSRTDFGADLFAFAVPLADSFFRDDAEVEGEEVEIRPASLGFSFGRPLGSYLKADLSYKVFLADYGSTDNTAPGFVTPSDHYTHMASLGARYARNGYQLRLGGTYHLRTEWEPWGLPGNLEDTTATKDYLTWEGSLGKTWKPAAFQRIGAEIAYAGGQDLDRFSKVQFGFFGGTRVHGYQGGRVRAEEAVATHLSYGFGVGDALRLDAIVDVAWATDKASGLDQELLAGFGIAGSFIGPWQTLVNIDLGLPVAGPDDGFVAYVVFLKLFR
jgi:hypothetical protein